MEALLRPARRSDLGALRTWVPTARDAMDWGGPSIPFPFTEVELVAALRFSPDSSFVLEIEPQNMVGFGQLLSDEESKRVHLARLIIDPQTRRMGFGRRLIELLIDQARDVPGRYFTLNVLPDNWAAKHLYLELGFEFAERPSGDPASTSDYMMRRDG